MKISKYKQELIRARKQRAFDLYKSGLTTRQVGHLINRSHAWVALAVKELSTDDNINYLTKIYRVLSFR